MTEALRAIHDKIARPLGAAHLISAGHRQPVVFVKADKVFAESRVGLTLRFQSAQAETSRIPSSFKARRLPVIPPKLVNGQMGPRAYRGPLLRIKSLVPDGRQNHSI